MHKFVFVLFSVNFFTTITGQNGCNFPYSSFPDKEPIFLHKNLSLIEPNSDGIHLSFMQEIYLACPGSCGAKNSFIIYPMNLTAATCSNDLLLINGVPLDVTQINCSKSITGDIVTVSLADDPVHSIKLIGYNITNSKWDTLFYILYNEERGEAVYSRHTLYGSAISYAKKESSRPGFKSCGLGSGVLADTAYKQSSQNSTFIKILGSTELANKYIYQNSYLSRGHLSPDADFVYVSSQFSTYFYVNTVPQWQVINNGNWKSLEGNIREYASGNNIDLEIITGGYKILSLPDVNGTVQPIYLYGNKLPVPKFTWKFAYDGRNNSGIVFVCVNDPFDDPKIEDYLCDSICTEHGWGGISWKYYNKGLIYCCDYNVIKDVIRTIPEVDVRNVLSNW